MFTGTYDSTFEKYFLAHQNEGGGDVIPSALTPELSEGFC